MVMVAREERGDEKDPSAAELAAIEAEWPQIELELALLDVEIAEATHGLGSGAVSLARRRYRRLVRRSVGRVAVVSRGLGVAA